MYTSGNSFTSSDAMRVATERYICSVDVHGAERGFCSPVCSACCYSVSFARQSMTTSGAMQSSCQNLIMLHVHMDAIETQIPYICQWIVICIFWDVTNRMPTFSFASFFLGFAAFYLVISDFTPLPPFLPRYLEKVRCRPEGQFDIFHPKRDRT